MRITVASFGKFCFSGTLNILRSNESDQGKYYCAAENRYGVVFSEGALFYVKGKF